MFQMKHNFFRSLILLSIVSLSFSTQSSEQNNDTPCDSGTQYCENNVLDTTNTTTTDNTNTNTNTNNNTNVNTNTNANTNVNTSTNANTNENTNVNTSTNANTNVNTNNSNATNTSTNTNANTNVSTNNSTSDSTVNSTVNQNVTNTSSSTANNSNTNKNTNVNTSKSDSNVQTNNVNQNNNNQDLCTVGRSGAFQGQVFGFSTGGTVKDENCERLKLSKYLYDTGMKVASVSILCQDSRVFKAMEMAGTPCPYKGKIGKEAIKSWANNVEDRPDYKEVKNTYIQRCKKTRNSNGKKKSKSTCVREFDAKA